MKNFLKHKFMFMLFLVFAVISCKYVPVNNNGLISFTYYKHNFHILPFKRKASYSFTFSNPGQSPLVILNVKTSCGCTVADWIKEPIKPGESGKITVTYDAAFLGKFHKEVSVFYNGKDSPVKLEIKGQVEYPKNLKPEEQ